MCGRYATVTKIKEIEKKFGVTASPSFAFEPTANITPGTMAPIIASHDPHHLLLMRFGMMPSWAKKPMLLINARAEGDHNKEDLEQFSGAKGIFEKPSFRKPIRSQRCLVIADYFFEGPKELGLSKPFCFYMKNNDRPFAMAGIWDEWKMPSGESLHSFAIVTTPANALLRAVGHHRSPLILDPADERKWLDTSMPMHELTSLMKVPLAESMNAYPVSPEIKNPKAQGLHLLHPIGERITPEYRYEVSQQLELFGMGESRARKRKNKE
jgi:putative SOS response-associated peptidase YedK